MIIAYYALHYGSDYLGYSIKSVYDHVNKIHILYTSRPSHGHASNMVNPDTKEKLTTAANLFGDPKGKIIWHEGQWNNEGAQRNTITEIAKQDNADTKVVVDSDEIWDEDVLLKSIEDSNKGSARNNCIRMLTFWRSFSNVCHDEMMPTRVICCKRTNNTVSYLGNRVNHFGYARSVVDVAYKMSIHGHKGEWRNDWFDKYKNWPKSGNIDLHPTCNNVWNATPYDKTKLPVFMRSHPYYNLEVIP